MNEVVAAAELAGNIIGGDGGAFVIAEWRDEGGVTDPPRLIAPLHMHHKDDEAWYVLKGALRIRRGDEVVEAAAGSAVFVPRGTPHTWQNVGAEPLRFFATIMPAAVAFEEFFKRYAQLPAKERGVEAFARVAAETKAFEVVGPPLGESDPL